MKKVLSFLVVIAVIWAAPPLRTGVLEALHPLLTKLGPVGERIAEPVKRHTAKTQVTAIVRGITHLQNQGKSVPDARTFPRWIKVNGPGETKGVDPWGSSYYMTQERREYVVGSPGPDRIQGNTDDITDSGTF